MCQALCCPPGMLRDSPATFISLCLSFLTYKTGMVIAISLSC